MTQNGGQHITLIKYGEKKRSHFDFLDFSSLSLSPFPSPHLTYASTVWNGCSDILFNKLNSLHRRATKLMISDSSLSTDTKLRYLGILPLKEKLMFNKTVSVFKAYKNLAPPYLKQLFICSKIRATSRYITLPKPRIDLLQIFSCYKKHTGKQGQRM